MTLILSAMALIAAAAALWLASTSSRRSDSNVTQVITAIRNENKQFRDTLEGRIAKIEVTVLELAKGFQSESTSRGKLQTEVNELKRETLVISASLCDLDGSIPQKFRINQAAGKRPS